MSYRAVLEAMFLLNGSLLAVGYALLAPSLRNRPFVTWISYCGVALLVGSSVVGVVLCGLAVAGLRIDLALFAAVSALLVAVGVVAALLLRSAVRDRLAPKSTRPLCSATPHVG